jgi:hypothetical protein
MATEEAETFLYMSDDPPTTFHRWPDLKVELKKRILAYLLDAEITHSDEGELNFIAGPEVTEDNLFPLIAVRNLELATLAQEVYYDVNDFYLYAGPDPGAWPNIAQGHRVRSLFIRVERCFIPKSSFDTLFREDDAWRFMLRYRDGYYDDMRLDEDDGPNSDTVKRGVVSILT